VNYVVSQWLMMLLLQNGDEHGSTAQVNYN